MNNRKIGKAMAKLIMTSRWRWEVGRQLRAYNDSCDRYDGEGLDQTLDRLGRLLIEILQEEGVNFDDF